MICLILVRHGNTFESNQTPTMVGARSDLPLTAQGCEQAKRFAHYLISERIIPNAIYAGGLKRQVQTAQIVSDQLAIESLVPSHEAALTEIDYGAWEGLTQEEVSSQWPREYNDWTTEARWVKGVFGRTQEEHIRDIKNWIEQLRTSHAPGNVVVGVTSNGVIRFFYSLQETEWLLCVKERKMEQLKVKTGHFCELHILKDAIKIKCWNAKPCEGSRQEGPVKQ